MRKEQEGHGFHLVMAAANKLEPGKGRLRQEDIDKIHKEAAQEIRSLDSVISGDFNENVAPAAQEALDSQNVHDFDRYLVGKYMFQMDKEWGILAPDILSQHSGNGKQRPDHRAQYIYLAVATTAFLEEFNGGDNSYLRRHYGYSQEDQQARTRLEDFTAALHTFKGHLDERLDIFLKGDTNTFSEQCYQIADRIRKDIYAIVVDGDGIVRRMEEEHKSGASEFKAILSKLEAASFNAFGEIRSKDYNAAIQTISKALEEYSEDFINDNYSHTENRKEVLSKIVVELHMLKAFAANYSRFKDTFDRYRQQRIGSAVAWGR